MNSHKMHFHLRISAGWKEKYRFQCIKKLLEDQKLYLDKDLKEKQLADTFRISVYDVSCAIRAVKKMSFKDFVNSYRVRTAAAIIRRNSRKKMPQVCREAGFGSMTAFYKAFRKFHGTTPARKRVRKKVHIGLLFARFVIIKGKTISDAV